MPRSQPTALQQTVCKLHLDPQYHISHWGSTVLGDSTLCKNSCTFLYFVSFTTTWLVEIFLYPPVLCGQYCGCWWAGDSRNWSVSSHVISLVLTEKYALIRRSAQDIIIFSKCFIYSYHIIIILFLLYFRWELRWWLLVTGWLPS